MRYLTIDRDDAVIVQTIIAMVRRLGMGGIAEGWRPKPNAPSWNSMIARPFKFICSVSRCNYSATEINGTQMTQIIMINADT